MSKIIASAAIRGGHEIYRQAEAFYEKALKEKGLIRLEGKEYKIQAGDVCQFRFNV